MTNVFMLRSCQALHVVYVLRSCSIQVFHGAIDMSRESTEHGLETPFVCYALIFTRFTAASVHVLSLQSNLAIGTRNQPNMCVAGDENSYLMYTFINDGPHQQLPNAIPTWREGLLTDTVAFVLPED